MTSIVSIVAAFMATFMLVFGYLTYSDSGRAEAPAAAATAAAPAAPASEPDR